MSKYAITCLLVGQSAVCFIGYVFTHDMGCLSAGIFSLVVAPLMAWAESFQSSI
jgi:hypothetical protein